MGGGVPGAQAPQSAGNDISTQVMPQSGGNNVGTQVMPQSGTGKYGGMANQGGGANPFQQFQQAAGQGVGNSYYPQTQQMPPGNSYYPQTQPQQQGNPGTGKFGGMANQQANQQQPFQQQGGQPNYSALLRSIAGMFGQQGGAPVSNYNPVQSANDFQLRNTYQFNPATDPSRQLADKIWAENHQRELDERAAREARAARGESYGYGMGDSTGGAGGTGEGGGGAPGDPGGPGGGPGDSGDAGLSRGGHVNPDKKIRAALLTAKGVQAKAVPGKSEGGDVAPALSSRVTDRRIPELQNAADMVAAGHMGPEEYHAQVGSLKPVRPYTSLPPMATREDLLRGLSKDKHGKIGAEEAIPEGHAVGLRLDIPAYNKHGVWAPTIHEGHEKNSKPIAHAPFAHVSNPVFSVDAGKALGVARGNEKAPFAKINGFWKKTSPEDAQAMAQEYLNHPEWRQVGMDPERHSFFYDRETRQPVASAEEALQIGPLVLAKNPKYGSLKDFQYENGGRVGYAGGGGEDDPTVQKALGLTQQAQPMAQPDPSPIPGAMQVAQAVTAPRRKRFEIAPARVAPMTIDQKDRDLPEEGGVTIKRLTDAFKRAIDNHLSLPPAQQIANARQAENNVAKYVGRGKTGKMNSVLTANKKLMKAQTAGEDDSPLTLPDGRTLEMTGLALMPDYREGQFKMCGNSDVCRDLCLGKEAGQYRYDKTATQTQIPTTKEELAEAGGKPRMAAFRRTMAMMRDPESFAVHLHELIDGAKIMAERRGSHLGVRLNVLSDLSPKIMEPIIKAHPEVSFYDYTKMNYDPVAPNHHYTYSSTGLSQPERGVENPFSNWRKLRDRLDQGHNVAMAFAHGKGDAFPEHLHDEETGKKYRVVSGDDHDFRPMDMVPEGEDGVIVALKNMAASNSEYKYENAARNSHGFFVHHEPNFERTAKGTFALNESGDRIPQNKIYSVPVQPVKRGAMRQKEN